VLALAVLFAWPTVHRWHFQRFLSEKATELADNHRAKVHCNTMFDTMLDSEMLAAGRANSQTGENRYPKAMVRHLDVLPSSP